MTVTAEDITRLETILGVSFGPEIRSQMLSPQGAVTGGAGSGNTATGTNAVSWGLNCTASGDQSTAGGFMCTATNQGAVAMGYACHATGQAAICMGFSSFAESAVAVAVGDGLDSIGVGSCTLTEDNTAIADHSYAFGEAAISEMYGMYAYASQGHTAPYADQIVQLTGQGAAAPVNLLLGDSTEIAVPNGRSAHVVIDITAVSTTTTDAACARYEGLITTEGGTLSIVDLTQTYVKNTPAYTFTISAPSGRTLRVNCDPGMATVNFIAIVRFMAIAGIA